MLTGKNKEKVMTRKEFLRKKEERELEMQKNKL